VGGGRDLEQFDILGLTQTTESASGVWPTPTDNLDAFCEGAVFTGHVPDLTKHEGRFAVVLEPVADGQMCRAAIAGVVPVYVSVQNEDDQWADINDGEYATLLSGASGAAQLLFKEEGVGDKWCLARLGPPAQARPRGRRQAQGRRRGDGALQGRGHAHYRTDGSNESSLIGF
jgi:hypothetical protein